MKAIDKMREYVEEISKPIKTEKQRRENLESRLSELKAEKESLDNSDSLDDVDNMVSVNSSIEVIESMLNKNTIKQHLEDNSKNGLGDLKLYYRQFYKESLEEINPKVDEIISKANELKILVDEMSDYKLEKYRELESVFNGAKGSLEYPLVISLNALQMNFHSRFLNSHKDKFNYWFNEFMSEVLK